MNHKCREEAGEQNSVQFCVDFDQCYFKTAFYRPCMTFSHEIM